MPYTTHGLMTAADLAEVRADYDLDLCSCCEGGGFNPGEPGDFEDGCATCGHGSDRHA
jgi:hypothetical protein